MSVIAIAVLLASCSDPIGPSAGAVDDLFAEITETWASSTNPVSVRPGLSYLASPPSARSCPYSGSAGRFVCPSRAISGLTFTTSFQLFDGNRESQAAFNSNTSDAMRTFADVAGSTFDGATVTSVTTSDERVLSGLLAGAHTLNGTGTSTFIATSGSTTTITTMVETTANLVLAPRGSANPWPSSGTVTTDVYSGIPGAGAILVATVTSTFDGTQAVSLVIQASGVTRTCTIDLKGAMPTICA